MTFWSVILTSFLEMSGSLSNLSCICPSPMMGNPLILLLSICYPVPLKNYVSCISCCYFVDTKSKAQSSLSLIAARLLHRASLWIGLWENGTFVELDSFFQ